MQPDFPVYNSLVSKISDLYGCKACNLVTLRDWPEVGACNEGLAIDAVGILGSFAQFSEEELIQTLNTIAQEGRIAFLSYQEEETVLHISKAAARQFHLAERKEVLLGGASTKKGSKKGRKVRVKVIDENAYKKMMAILKISNKAASSLKSFSGKLLASHQEKSHHQTISPYGSVYRKPKIALSAYFVNKERKADEESYRQEHAREKDERAVYRKLILLQSYLTKWFKAQELLKLDAFRLQNNL